MKIMLVDDSMVMRRMERQLLAGLGHTDVVEAGNGSDAIEILEKNPEIGLVMLDWHMPVMDGLTFVKTVRASGKYPALKIIMATSDAEKNRVAEAIKAGANNYLVKPFNAESLGKKLALINNPAPTPAGAPAA